MDVIFCNLLQLHHYGQSVRRGNRPGHARRGLVHLGTAISRVVNVGVGGDAVGVDLRGRLFVDGLGEGDEEAVLLDVDLFNLEGHDAIPVDALEGKWGRPAHRPLAARGEASGDQLSLGRKLHVHDPGGQPFAEGITRALPHAVDLLGRRAHDQAETVVAKEKLVVEGTEFAAGFVEPEAGDRAAHFDVGKLHCRRHELLHAFLLHAHARITVGFERGSFHARGERIPVVARRMAEEGALLEMLERTASIPWTLALDDKHRAFCIRAHAAWAAQPAAHGNHFPLRRHLHRPAAEEIVRFIRTAQAQGHPDVAFGIVLRPKGEFVTLGIAPVAGQRVVAVGDFVTVGVGDAADLAPGGGRHRAVAPREREGLVLPAGEEVKLGLRWSLERALHEIDVAAPRAHREPAVGKNFKTARPHRDSDGDRDVNDGIILRFLRSRAPHRPEVFRGAEGRSYHDERGSEDVTQVYHWYSRVRVERPLGSVSGMRTSPLSPSRTMPMWSLVMRSWSLSAVKVRSAEPVIFFPAAARK